MSVQNLPQKIGIIAGKGDLPRLLLEACDAQGIDVFVIGFEGQADLDLIQARPHKVFKLGQVGKAIKALKAESVQDLVLIGSLRRPALSELSVDLKGAGFLARFGLKNGVGASFGDSDLLSALRAFLEDEGFSLKAVQDFAPTLLRAEGVLTKAKPSKDDWIDIRRGVDVLQSMAELDIGQAVLVQEGLVLGVEAVEGTDGLIDRCGALKRKGRKGVLVKLCKPQQDTALDLPTCGLKTLEKVKAQGFGGVVLHANKSLVIDCEALVSYADKHHLYIVMVNPRHLDGVSPA